MSLATEQPSSQAVNHIELVSVENSTIDRVNVYSNRAEVTRGFSVDVKKGSYQVIITGLPNALDHASVRIECQSAAMSIGDVAISMVRRPVPPSAPSPVISNLTSKKEKGTKELERTRKMRASLEDYLNLSNMKLEQISVTQMRDFITEFKARAEELDNRILQLEPELREIEDQIKFEREGIVGKSRPNDKLNNRIVIRASAHEEGKVDMKLTYGAFNFPSILGLEIDFVFKAVNSASWIASYDIRVGTEASEPGSVKLTYKAVITQTTGEDWTEVPEMLLHTTIPAFGAALPKFDSWGLSIYKAQASRTKPESELFSPTQPLPRARKADSSQTAHRMMEGAASEAIQMEGPITVLSDGVARNLTIISSKELEGILSWICVPKKDTKVHFSAKIKNTSEHTFLNGEGNIYVGSTFTSRSRIPNVSPQESFDCSLGVDPLIRVTYHAYKQSRSERRFFSKNKRHVFKQLVTVHNMKDIAINAYIGEQVPVSEDEQIQVTIVAPETIRSQLQKTELKTEEGWSNGMVVRKNKTQAVWEGADEVRDEDTDMLEKNGRFFWVCEIQPQGKVDLRSHWEVVAPAQEKILGLQ
ncbi:hypothetical protein H0H92_013768 [Tricholoma furcatifolium]|nr:hypothetical protein H0H92_013768 [Tricholoma furcatifolium]